LQKLISDFWPDEGGDLDFRQLFSEIIPAANVAPREEDFCKKIDQLTGWWWLNKGFSTFHELNDMFWARMKQVLHMSLINPFYLSSFYSMKTRVY
jgi:hypothetical protein